jgi:hypothetical protein
MAGRQRSTFQKRQKEVKRLEAQKMKRDKRVARQQERALNRAAGIDGSEIPPSGPEMGSQEEFDS